MTFEEELSTYTLESSDCGVLPWRSVSFTACKDRFDRMDIRKSQENVEELGNDSDAADRCYTFLLTISVDENRPKIIRNKTGK